MGGHSSSRAGSGHTRAIERKNILVGKPSVTGDRLEISNENSID
jgi:hypothetical protein